MPIRIGNQTSFNAQPVTIPFDYAVASGFSAFEWFPDKKESGAGWTESDLSQKTRQIIKGTALANDISLSVHAPIWINPIKPEDREPMINTLKLAEDIGASLVNIHLNTGQGIAAYGKALMPFMEFLIWSGIKLSIENTPDNKPEDFNALFEYLFSHELLDAAHIGMCLDLGHANLYPSTRNDYLKFIGLIDPKVPIIHIHMHENYGDNDSHLTLFTGPAGKDSSGVEKFMETMIKRNFSGSIIFEQWPQPPGMLNNAYKKLSEIIDQLSAKGEKGARP